MRHITTLTLTIPNGGTVSGAISQALGASTDSLGQQLSGGRSALGTATGVVIYSPAALTGTITVQVQPRGSPSLWLPYSPGGAAQTFGINVAFPVAPGFSDMRLSSSASEAAARTFIIEIQEDMD